MVAAKHEGSPSNDRLEYEKDLYTDMVEQSLVEAERNHAACGCRFCLLRAKINTCIAWVFLAAVRDLEGHPDMMEELGQFIKNLSGKNSGNPDT